MSYYSKRSGQNIRLQVAVLLKAAKKNEDLAHAQTCSKFQTSTLKPVLYQACFEVIPRLMTEFEEMFHKIKTIFNALF